MEDAGGDDHQVGRADCSCCGFERGGVGQVEAERDDFRVVLRVAVARAGMDACATRIGGQLLHKRTAQPARGAEDGGGIAIMERSEAHDTALRGRDP